MKGYSRNKVWQYLRNWCILHRCQQSLSAFGNLCYHHQTQTTTYFGWLNSQYITTAWTLLLEFRCAKCHKGSCIRLVSLEVNRQSRRRKLNTNNWNSQDFFPTKLWACLHPTSPHRLITLLFICDSCLYCMFFDFLPFGLYFDWET